MRLKLSKDKQLNICLHCGSKPRLYCENEDCYYIQCICGICTVACEIEEKAILIWNNERKI